MSECVHFVQNCMNVFKNAPLPDLKNRLILSQGKLPASS